MRKNPPGLPPRWKRIWEVDKKTRPKYIRLKEAVKIANELGISCTPTTMANWCAKTGIGYKIGKFWYVRVKKLFRFLEEEPVFYEDSEKDNGDCKGN